ncbi:MAG: galactose-1-phosphate uridylyltransferase [Cytophagaceae bacterium]|nr:galactose-1-phosphate uridylyltransferase [Cytophagaceae bacterium]|tara:strand:- start:6615 stop:7649 length:1035 start_codon:yes stop_codon:yes gene_type:complete
MIDFNNSSHRRYNILTGEWILVSPHRTKRPWQGKEEEPAREARPSYDPTCYLCPGNERAGGSINPEYTRPWSFTNDFAALQANVPIEDFEDGLLRAESETGTCKVVCFSPDHSLTLPVMEVEAIDDVIQLWQKEFKELGARQDINYVQIFENKGATMGCSNPHPHGQIWAQHSIPQEVSKKGKNMLAHWEKNKSSLLGDYLAQELEAKERILIQSDHFVALVPYWAVWPYEVMILPRKKHKNILSLNAAERADYAKVIKLMTIKYDNLFKVSFPYSAGIHQAPTDGKEHEEWHFHMSFYPPLLRSATVKKFMVGYEMFATPQRDITAEMAADTLRNLPNVHYLG